MTSGKEVIHGVDIATLEGWLIKYKSKGKFFGTSNKRWFKVNVLQVDDAKDNPRLTLSYFKSKKATETRGWIYLEDVTDIHYKSDVMEIVSPSRTLRLKGETTAEHKMWYESLRQLCFPEPVAEKSEPVAHAKSPLVKAVPAEAAPAPAKAAIKSPEAPARSEKKDERASSPSFQPSALENKPLPQPSKSDEKKGEPQPARIESKPSKDLSAEAKAPVKARAGSVLDDLKPRNDEENTLDFSESEDSDDDNEHDAGPSSSQRDGKTSRGIAKDPTTADNNYTDAEKHESTHESDFEHDEGKTLRDEDNSNNAPLEAKPSMALEEDDETKIEQFEQSPRPQTRDKRDNPYFDDEDNDEEPPKESQAPPPKAADMSSVRADNNFVTEDWDEEEPAPVSKKASPSKEKRGPRTGGVQADANFVTEDWD
ncbi:unnamed protein product [Aphanomyces euteiches]